jgi:NAD(P)H-hydrate epimerase
LIIIGSSQLSKGFHMILVSVKEMQAIEAEADAKGVSYAQMMQNAGTALALVVANLFLDENEKVVLSLVGSGNNGGDALVAMNVLMEEGWQATAYVVRPRADDDLLVVSFKEKGGKLITVDQDGDFYLLDEAIRSSSLILDGVLGTGTQLPLKMPLAKVLAHVAAFEDLPVVIAVDCPSGIDCDTGDADAACIPADLTVCMAAVKQGMLAFPAFELLGALEVVPIGLPKDLESLKNIRNFVVSAKDVREVIPLRRMNSHKGVYGTAMIVAGSVNYTGAALLAGVSAARIGTGLVSMAVPASIYPLLGGQFPDAIWTLLPEKMGVIDENASQILVKPIKKARALLVGPGLGLEKATGAFLARLLASGQKNQKRNHMGFLELTQNDSGETEFGLPPMVIDADGLKHLAAVEDWHEKLPEGSVLTPHPGEMAALTGLSIDEIQASRLEVAQKYAQEWKQVVVLKGALTVVANPDGRLAVIPIATSALAHAGTGDVLAGMIVGLRAQGLSAFDAAMAGAWIHAQAALIATDEIGHPASVLASDLVQFIPDILETM